MTQDPRSPVLVGCGQVTQRVDDPSEAAEPLELMARAAALAAQDAECPALLGALDSIRVPRGIWGYANPAALLRQRFGAPRAQTALGPISGSTVQVMLSRAAHEVAEGVRDVVLRRGPRCASQAHRRAVAALRGGRAAAHHEELCGRAALVEANGTLRLR